MDLNSMVEGTTYSLYSTSSNCCCRVTQKEKESKVFCCAFRFKVNFRHCSACPKFPWKSFAGYSAVLRMNFSHYSLSVSLVVFPPHHESFSPATKTVSFLASGKPESLVAYVWKWKAGESGCDGNLRLSGDLLSSMEFNPFFAD